METIVVNENDNLKRLDVFLTEFTGESRNFILKNIKSGNILVNNNVVKGGYTLKTNDVIEIGNLKVDTTIKGEKRKWKSRPPSRTR